MEFQEKQRLNLWWLYILLGLETIVVGSIILFDKGGMSLNDLKEAYYIPIIALLLPYLIVYLITINSFFLQIDENGISYHYWPFSKKKVISWTGIESLYMRKYDALGEYGGWGVKTRLWFKLNDKAYIFNDSNLGLQLLLPNNKKILFSITNTDELNLFLINLKKRYNIGAIETDVRER
jgi:hypothetical protein